MEPLHAPEAVQEVALVTVQESVVLPPEATWVGLAERSTVGFDVTVTVAETDDVPPVPVQERVYILDAARAPVDSVPPVALFPPVQPPDAVQEVAFVMVQESVDEPPEATDEGLAEREICGGGEPAIVTVAVALPDPPAGLVQVSV